MVDGVGRFVRAMKEGGEPYWLTLLGSSGAGKTYLARRVWKWYLGSGLNTASVVKQDGSGRDEVVYPGQWCYWPELAGMLSGGSGYDVLDELSKEKFVVFDEVGADRDPSGNIRNCLARALCSRVGKWTMVTSNKTLAGIGEDIDVRIASRMVRDGSVVVEVDVPDYSVANKD